MFVNKNQMPHGKYGRDACIGCLRRLGFGHGTVGRILHIDKGTVAKIVRLRVPQPRFEGFDRLWASLRTSSYVRPPAQPKQPVSDWFTLDHKAVLAHERAYGAMYHKQYRDHAPSRTQKKVLAKKQRLFRLRKEDPERYAVYMERERINYHRRRGVPLEEVPVKGSYVAPLKLSEEERKSIAVIRRRRDHLRLAVRQVWKGEVGDVAAMNRVGCTVREFQKHIRGMMKRSWTRANYGTVWNFDHVLPCSQFDVFCREDVAKLNHFTNIRPCCFMENSLKSG